MSAVLQPSLFDGLTRKARGQARVRSAVSVTVCTAIDNAIAYHAILGEPFDAEDVRERLREQGIATIEQPNVLGQAFTTAARAGIIAPHGWRTADRPERHASVLRVWVGTGR